MANAIFYQNARNIAYASQFPIDYELKMKTENPIVLQNIFDNFANYLLNAWYWKLKVIHDSQRGLQNTLLYTYFRTDMYQGYPVNILINGPNLDYSWFGKNGFNSVLNQLSVALAPGKVENVFTTRPKGSYILLSWYL